MNKKGVVFTLMAIILLGLMVAYFAVKQDVYYREQPYDVIEARFSIANGFVKSLERDYIPSVMKMAAIAATDELVIHGIETSSFYGSIPVLNDQYERLMLNGTMNHSSGSNHVVHPRMSSYIVESLFDNLADLSDKSIHIRPEFEVTSMNVFQDDSTGPWAFKVNFTYNLFVNTSVASWERINRHDSVEVSIIGMTDPYVAIASRKRGDMSIVPLNRTIIKSNYVPGMAQEAKNFRNVVVNTEYLYSTNAPSFFDRLVGYSGTFNASSRPVHSNCCGIVSFINPNETQFNPADSSPQAFPELNNNLDYCFFLPMPKSSYQGDSGVGSNEFMNGCGFSTDRFGVIYDVKDVTNTGLVSSKFRLNKRSLESFFADGNSYLNQYACEECEFASCPNNPYWECKPRVTS